MSRRRVLLSKLVLVAALATVAGGGIWIWQGSLLFGAAIAAVVTIWLVAMLRAGDRYDRRRADLEVWAGAHGLTFRRRSDAPCRATFIAGARDVRFTNVIESDGEYLATFTSLQSLGDAGDIAVSFSIYVTNIELGATARFLLRERRTPRLARLSDGAIATASDWRTLSLESTMFEHRFQLLVPRSLSSRVGRVVIGN